MKKSNFEELKDTVSNELRQKLIDNPVETLSEYVLYVKAVTDKLLKYNISEGKWMNNIPHVINEIKTLNRVVHGIDE